MTPPKSIARSLGEFVGHLWSAVRHDPTPGARREVRRVVEEEDRGDVVLRRTTIEEVELRGSPARRDRERRGGVEP
ncbi:MAG TPA: hypothetical protein PKC43_05185 [Phycisphaerales bacterium]|nr:hypothetical protein [Phycisphaerales bacterium]HMP36824.1 hypothetical protein [Phycisphaerales bacterium]